MKYLFPFLLMAFAAPVVAQESRECRGKESFQLSDGSSGCVLGVGTTTISSKVTVDGVEMRNRKSDSALVVVAMAGEFDTKRRVTSRRLKEVCSHSMAAVQQKFSGEPYKYIVVGMKWPGKTMPRASVANGGKFLNQAAYLTTKCRSPQYFVTKYR